MNPLFSVPRYPWLLLSAMLLTGCVTPKVVHVYDEKCQVMTRKMELTVEKA
jgi:PBP1b-binding outer membrane lipoprotein LpoB